MRTVVILDDDATLQRALKKELEQRIPRSKVIKAPTIEQAQQALKQYRASLAALVVNSHVSAATGSLHANTLGFIAEIKRLLVAQPIVYIGMARDMTTRRQLLAADCSFVFDKEEDLFAQKLADHLFKRLKQTATGIRSQGRPT